jgi:16S rRNA (uracil1498-N3)-methyltransferase
MPRRRFFIPRDQIRNGCAVLTPDQAHHLRAVLRLRAGDEVELFDGEGTGYAGAVELRGAEIRVVSLRKLEPAGRTGNPLTLGAALIKPDRFEWMLQKGTELGVDSFLPLQTRFSTVRIPPARWTARRERWERIVREACKQCRRAAIPKIQEPLPFLALLDSPQFSGYAKFLLHESTPERLGADLPAGAPVLLCVGPEGGWDPAETLAARRAGFRVVSMGNRILRAETAALAAVAIFQFLLDGTRLCHD